MNVFDPFAIAFRKLPVSNGRWENQEKNNPKEVFFKYIDKWDSEGKKIKAYDYLVEARKRAIDWDNVELVRELNSKITHITSREANKALEHAYDEMASVKAARKGFLDYVKKTRLSDLSEVPKFEETAKASLEPQLAELLSIFAAITIDLRREIPAYLFKKNQKLLNNKYGEEQTPLDIFANNAFRDAAIQSGFVNTYISEEEKKPVKGLSNAPYIVTCDPLDGSSNIDTGNSLGTIISIIKKNPLKDSYFTGHDIVASMLVLYGSSLEMLFAAEDKDGKMGNLQKFVSYEMDDGKERYLLLNDDIKVPQKHKFFGWSGNESMWGETSQFTRFFNSIKNLFKPRVHGCIVAEAFECASKNGSTYTYSATNEYANGKIREVVEAKPIVRALKAGGGEGWNFNLENESVLDPAIPIGAWIFKPEDYSAGDVEASIKEIDRRTQIIMGSKATVEKAKESYRAAA